jgi:hypothetical protein
MSSEFKKFTLFWLMAVSMMAVAPEALSFEYVGQYRGAVTKLFLSDYHAMPVFTLNPVFPGDVIMLKNETKAVRHDECYPNLAVGKYRALGDYHGVASFGLSGDLQVGGEILREEIASIEAGGNAKFARTGAITVSPLSEEDVDLATLKAANFKDPNCRIISEVLRGEQTGAALTQKVLHGRIHIKVTTTLQAGMNASARSDLLKKIAGTFKITQAEIKISGNGASFLVSDSPDNMSLAFVPTGYDSEELARITYFLQGKRGADLEIAVTEATTATELSDFQRNLLRIRDILGSDELRNKERWAERIVGNTPTEDIVKLSYIDFRKVGTFCAAMELERQEAPPQHRR